MARRTATVTKRPGDFKYDSLAACENPANDTGGYHLVKPKAWPPSKRNNPDGTMSLQCEHCNAWCIVSDDNDPELTSIKIVIPEAKKKSA